MNSTDTVIIGAGQAGLAASASLSARGHENVILERGQVADRWRRASWDSLHLLTPNWMTRLPGYSYRGPEPEGFLSAAQTVALLDSYATAITAPVVSGAEVTSVRRHGEQFEVRTKSAFWSARSVVIATGWCDVPHVPPAAAQLTTNAHVIAAESYRNPAALPDGDVLVVGASATGVQIASELRRAGRDVTVAVGTHSRAPRTYRGLDIYWWLEQVGSLDRTLDTVTDPAAARHEPSLQLVGSTDRHDVDLATLQADGVRLTGRVVGSGRQSLQLAPDLANTTMRAELQLRSLVQRFDRHADDVGLTTELLEPEPIRPVVPTAHRGTLHLRRERIGTVIWATGYRRRYDWLELPVLDASGEIRQHRGVTDVAGLYVLGQRFQHTRRSSFIDGVGPDAAYVADHIARTAAGHAGSGTRRTR